jgi:hypothetical protein
MKEHFTNAQSDPLFEAATKILTGQIYEAYGESWVVYNKDTKAKISKSFKTRKAAYDYASKNGGVVYSAEYYFDNKDEIHSGKLVKEDFSEETINENKKVTSEKSQFGGFRPKIVNGDGSIFFLGSQAFKTSQGAEKAAQYYLDQYERGVNTKNIKMMKGDYVKESELQEMTKTAKDIKKGDSFKANLKIPGKGVDISKAYTVIATDDAMDSKTHPGKLVNIRVKAGNYTTVVPFEKNQKVDLVEETIDEESYRTPRYPLVYKTMKTVEDLDQDELEEFLLTLSNYISNGDLSEIGDIFDDRLYDEVGAHLFRAAKVWKNRYNK